MKKIFAILSTVLVLASCSESNIAEIENPQQEENASSPVTFNITVQEQGATKALKTDWADGDVIYIRFKGINTKYIYITYNSSTSSWDVTESSPFSTSDFSDIADVDKTASAVHYPIPVEKSLDANGSLLFTDISSGNRVENAYFLYCNNTAYTISGASVNLSLTLSKADDVVLFHIPGIQANAADYNLFITGGNSLSASNIHYSNNEVQTPQGDAYAPIYGFADQDGVIFAVFFKSGLGAAQDYTFTVKGPVQEYTISGTKTLNAGYQYSLPALNDAKWTTKFKPFTVAAGKQVYIAPGNLQATTTNSGENWTWSFAEHQYDCPGGTGSSCDNMKVTADGKSSVTNCTIGLFGWSTDDNTYFGINSSTTATDWDGSFVDWGTLEIGGYAANTWRTPTGSEYNYLLKSRTTSTVCGTENARYARATVNGIEGNILFPDAYTHPDGVADIVNINVKDAANNGNTISASDWDKMEAAGAVFLPQAGYNEGYDYVATGRACYWTISNNNSTMADYYLQQESDVSANYSGSRSKRISVRLFHNIN